MSEQWDEREIKYVKSYKSHIRHLEIHDGRVVVITDNGVDSFIPELPDTQKERG